MGLTDVITAVVRSHTGLHYVPSFNDFVSGAADDVEAYELDHEAKRDQEPRPTVNLQPEIKNVTNKSDDLPAMTSTIGDIHKVNRPLAVGPGAGRADWIIDNARGGRNAPSVWQYIIASKSGEKLPTFDDLSRGRSGTVGWDDLQKHFNVSPTQAEAMVAEADKDNDSRISREEFEDIMSWV